MSSVNRVIIVGNLGADPEIRNTQAGNPIANMRIATSEHWRDKNSGEKREKTEWHTVAVFNEMAAKACGDYLSKGDKVFIEGQLQTRKWQTRDGEDRYSTEVVVPAFGGRVVFLNTKGGSDDRTDNQSRGRDSGSRRDSQSDSRRSTADDRPRERSQREMDLDDEVPF